MYTEALTMPDLVQFDTAGIGDEFMRIHCPSYSGSNGAAQNRCRNQDRILSSDCSDCLRPLRRARLQTDNAGTFTLAMTRSLNGRWRSG